MSVSAKRACNCLKLLFFADKIFSKCRRLVVYGNLTLIGPESGYFVEQPAEIAGATMMRETEPDWDW